MRSIKTPENVEADLTTKNPYLEIHFTVSIKFVQTS